MSQAAAQLDLLDLLAEVAAVPDPDPAVTVPTRRVTESGHSVTPVEPVDSMLRRELNPRGHIPWRWLTPGGDLKVMWRAPDLRIDPDLVRLNACPQEDVCQSAGWTKPVGEPPSAFVCGYCGLPPAVGVVVGEHSYSQADITAQVVGEWLSPRELLRVIRCLGTKRIDDVRRDMVGGHRSLGGPEHHLIGTSTGILVEQWFGEPEFAISWNKVFAAVRARVTPELTEALAAVCDGTAGGCTPEQWAAADAILPRRRETH